jgi:hypothetical protein
VVRRRAPAEQRARREQRAAGADRDPARRRADIELVLRRRWWWRGGRERWWRGRAICLGLLRELRLQGLDAALDRAAVVDVLRDVQVLFVRVDRALRVAEPLERAPEVVEQDRLGIRRIRLAQEIGGVLELARLVRLVALLEQLERLRAAVGLRVASCGASSSGARRCRSASPRTSSPRSATACTPRTSSRTSAATASISCTATSRPRTSS